MKQIVILAVAFPLFIGHPSVVAFAPPLSRGVRAVPSNKDVLAPVSKSATTISKSCTQLRANPTDIQEQPRKGPVVNWSLVRQTVINQAVIGSTIWTGGLGAQVLANDASFSTSGVLLGVAGTLPLIAVSRLVETAEAPAVADLNLSTNMVVLRLFGDKPQPIVAFVVSALLGGLTGIVEETTFRGEVLPFLSDKFDSLPAGFALSTLIFAVLHVNPLGLFRGGQATLDAVVLVLYQLVTGSIFGLLLLLTNNLAVPIIAHGLFDTYVFYVTHLIITTQMEYARNEALMPAAPNSIEAKWRKERGEDFLYGCKETFYLADSNRDGVLSREELRIALYSYGVRLTADESETVTRAADADDSGTIEFSEFLEFVGPSGSPGKAIKGSLLGST